MRAFKLVNLIFIFGLIGLQANPSVNLINSNNNTINKRLDCWLSYYDLKLDFFTDTIQFAKQKEIHSDYDYSSDSSNLFKDFFIYSIDSSLCIDLDSYSRLLEKDSLGQLFSDGSEVDSEVAMIDIKAKKRIRLLFCGTDCKYEESQWIKTDLVCILGFISIDNKYYPTIWQYDINNSSFQMIKTKYSIDLSAKDYVVNKRLQMIRFKK